MKLIPTGNGGPISGIEVTMVHQPCTSGTIVGLDITSNDIESYFVWFTYRNESSIREFAFSSKRDLLNVKESVSYCKHG